MDVAAKFDTGCRILPQRGIVLRDINLLFDCIRSRPSRRLEPTDAGAGGLIWYVEPIFTFEIRIIQTRSVVLRSKTCRFSPTRTFQLRTKPWPGSSRS